MTKSISPADWEIHLTCQKGFDCVNYNHAMTCAKEIIELRRWISRHAEEFKYSEVTRLVVRLHGLRTEFMGCFESRTSKLWVKPK